MENTLDKHMKQQNCRIYFPQRTFGKPNKDRREDPSMFEILSCGTEGFQKHCFKKDQKFQQTNQAYLNMIGKSPWKSQSQENFVNYYDNFIQANPSVIHNIQTYIQEREPKSHKNAKRISPKNDQKPRSGSPSAKQGKQQYKGQTDKHQNQKGISNSDVIQDLAGRKQLNKSKSRETFSLSKKARIPEQTKYQSQHKKIANSGYGQSLQKNKLQDQEISQQEQQKLIKKFKQTTRWIPNSSFTTYFGKPPFQNYGRGNTRPIDGGLIYGTYLYSHNVHPHRGNNHPKNLQSYPIALKKAKSHGTLMPTHPRTKPDYSKDLSKTNANETDQQSRIEPQVNYFSGQLDISVPCLEDMQKFGGKPSKRVSSEVPAG